MSAKPQENVIEIPVQSKTIECGKCGRTMTVNKNCCFAICAQCSQGLGVKK